MPLAEGPCPHPGNATDAALSLRHPTRKAKHDEIYFLASHRSFSLAVLSTTTFASDAPTLDDTTAGEFTTTAITAQAETVTDDVPAAEATEPAVMPAEPATEMPLDDVSPFS